MERTRYNVKVVHPASADSEAFDDNVWADQVETLGESLFFRKWVPASEEVAGHFKTTHIFPARYTIVESRDL